MINKKRTGFTLVETLMAILILSMAVAGPMTVASRGLNAALVSKNKTIALYLAQDAMEYVRYRRDTNRLANASWLTGLDSCISNNNSKSCYFDTLSSTITTCTGSCPVLNYDTSTALFTYSSTGGTVSASNFTRTVYITTPVCNADNSLCNTDEAQVRVEVTWLNVGGASTKSKVTLQEDIFNWQ